jgi:hypothetical protein
LTESFSPIEQELTSRTARSNRLLWVGVIVFVILMGVSLYLFTYLSRLRPGEVVDRFGTYISPRGKYRITIEDQPATGLVKIDVETKVSGLWMFAKYRHGWTEHYDRERDWMICFDEYDRLWSYMGRWPGKPGTQRTLPGGGTRPNFQAVALRGFHFAGGKRITFGSTVVSQTGRWEGVPPEFFSRLPQASDTGWPPGAVVPEHPVSFTRAQLNRFR